MKVDKEHYDRAARFLPWRLEGVVSDAEILPHWLPSGDAFTYVRRNRTGTHYVLVDIGAREQRPAFDHESLAVLLARHLGSPVAPEDLPVEHIELVDASGQQLTLYRGEEILDCDLEAGTIKPRADVSRSATDGLHSPDGQWLLRVENHNLQVEGAGGKRTLTSDGCAGNAYGKSPDFNTTTVALRMMHAAAPLIGVWSPDSRRFFTHQLDERALGCSHLLQTVPEDGGLRPRVHTYRFPFAGETETALWSPVIVDPASGAVIRADVPPVEINDHTPAEWLRVWWSTDAQTLWFVTSSRDKTEIVLHRMDARTGAVTTLLRQTADSYQFLTAGTPRVGNEGRPNVRFLERSRLFIWYDDSGAMGRLYLHDLESGIRLNAITPDTLLVRDILKVDEDAGVIWFSASCDIPGQDPYYRHVYRVSLTGEGLQLLTPEDTDHNVYVPLPGLPAGAMPALSGASGLSPDGRWFVDTMNRVDRPPVTVLRDGARGDVLMTVAVADTRELEAIGWRWPEVFTAKAADGVTDLYGVTWRPSWTDSSRRLPVIMIVYPGPQITIVPKVGFRESSRASFNYTFCQSLAELGFIVVQVDPRGTALRDRDFRLHSYGNLGGRHQHEDYVAVLEQLAEQQGDLDLERIGIHGHSGGGYSTARAMLTFPDIFKVGVASAGNHDLRGVLAMWCEALHGPADRYPWDGLDNAALASNLKGKLLIAFSDMDENVHPGLSMRLIDALIKADKDFDMLVLPNAMHDFAASSRYFLKRVWNYFVEHLAGDTPPAHYRFPD